MKWKWLTVPFSNETKQVEAAQLWEVRWESRYGEWSNSTKPEVEAFTDEKSAMEFAAALRNAFGLIRHTCGTDVALRKGTAK